MAVGTVAGFGQQNGAPLQWLPHPAVSAPRVHPAAAEVPPTSPLLQETARQDISSQVPTKGAPNPTAREMAPSLAPSEAPSSSAPGGHLFPAPLGEMAPLYSPKSVPEVVEPPYLPEESSKPIPGGVPGTEPLRGRPAQVRAECLADANLLLPIHKLTTRIDIDPNVHPEISPEQEAQLRRAGQSTRLDQLTRAKTEFDAKMWCDPPPTPLPDRMTHLWPETTMTWKASALCHKPLYFEQAHLERYGHTTGPLTQPIISAGHFYLMMPILPYQLALWPPYECIYTLGHYRPGSCAPHYLDPIPLSIRAGLAEAGAWVGGVFLVP